MASSRSHKRQKRNDYRLCLHAAQACILAIAQINLLLGLHSIRTSGLESEDFGLRPNAVRSARLAKAHLGTVIVFVTAAVMHIHVHLSSKAWATLQGVKATGAEYLEAPVSGSKQPAEQGTLIFLTGGDESLFQKSGPLLDIMGKAKFFLGGVSSRRLTHDVKPAFQKMWG